MTVKVVERFTLLPVRLGTGHKIKDKIMTNKIFRYFVKTDESGEVHEIEGFLDEGIFKVDIPSGFQEVTEQSLSVNIEELWEEAEGSSGKVLMFKNNKLYVHDVFVFTEGM